MIIAYDALLGSQGSWEEFCKRGILHGGDNDTTGGKPTKEILVLTFQAIGGAWFGAYYGLQGVFDNHSRFLEKREQLEDIAKHLFRKSHNSF